jgi:hypothetical protein
VFVNAEQMDNPAPLPRRAARPKTRTAARKPAPRQSVRKAKAMTKSAARKRARR